MRAVKTYFEGGQAKLYSGKPKKKGVSQQERKDYAEMKAAKERARLQRKAERFGRRAERRGEEPIGYRETVSGGNPRFLQESTMTQTPIYQDQYDMLQRASEVHPDDVYHAVAGSYSGGKGTDPCAPGNKGAGAAIACSARTAMKVARQRKGRGSGGFMDRLMMMLQGRQLNRGTTDMQRRFSPYNDQEKARIAFDMGGPTRGITLNNSGYNLRFE